MINWALMMIFVLPLSVYSLFKPLGRDEEMIYDAGQKDLSYYGFLADWVAHYQIDGEFWGHVGTIAISCLGPAVVLGFFAQFAVQIMASLLRRRRLLGNKPT